MFGVTKMCEWTRVTCAALVVLAACGDQGKTTEPVLVVDRVDVSRASAVLVIAGHVQLTATPRASGGEAVSTATVTWSSDRPAATVSQDGIVTGVSAGSASITATASGKTAHTLVTILNGAAGDLAILPSRPTLALGQSIQLSAVAFDASGLGGVASGVTWASSDASVLQVSNGMITANAEGSATITATASGKTGVAVPTVVVFSSIAPMGRSEPLEFVGPTLDPPDTLSQTAICAVTTSRRLYCAGQGYGSMAIPVAADKTFKTVVSGGWSSCGFATKTDQLHHCSSLASFCALTLDGVPYCWTLGDPEPVPTSERFASISPTEADSGRPPSGCGLTSAGAAFCWGAGGGRLGNGGFAASPVPVAVATSETFAEIVTSIKATCARTAPGKIYCWGRTLVSGQRDSTASPAALPTALTFSKLMRGGCSVVDNKASVWCFVSTCAIATGTNTVYCWNPGGAPAALSTDLQLASVAPVAGPGYSAGMCGLTTIGALACWGVSYWGADQFGVASTSLPMCGLYPCYNNPTITLPNAHFTTLFGGAGNLCAIDASARALCWGPNAAGQLTNSTVKLGTPTPTLFSIDPTR